MLPDNGYHAQQWGLRDKYGDMVEWLTMKNWRTWRKTCSSAISMTRSSCIHNWFHFNKSTSRSKMSLKIGSSLQIRTSIWWSKILTRWYKKCSPDVFTCLSMHSKYFIIINDLLMKNDDFIHLISNLWSTHFSVRWKHDFIARIWLFHGSHTGKTYNVY